MISSLHTTRIQLRVESARALPYFAAALSEPMPKPCLEGSIPPSKINLTSYSPNIPERYYIVSVVQVAGAPQSIHGSVVWDQ
jgi:hypothetical protein